MGPQVSILMTSYNREKYIASAIESVLRSTYENFELIVVDDRSADTTVAIARSFAEKDKRVKVFINDTNLGDYPNRNEAASYASGKYLKYVDADDLIYPHGLEQLVFYMEQFPDAGYGLCSLPQDDNNVFPFQLAPQEAYRRHYFQTPLFHKAPLSSIISKKVFEAVGGFSSKRMVGDFEMWHRLSQKFPVVLMPHGIVWYRKHNEQEMSSYHQFAIDYVLVSENMLRSVDCPLDNSEIKTALKRLRKYKLKKLIKHSLKLQYADCIRLVQSF